MTKEQFIINWVLARASFKVNLSGAAAAREAADVYELIKKLAV